MCVVCFPLRGRILAKRINVRIEHVKHSKSRLSFLTRVHENEKQRALAKETGVRYELKRQVCCVTRLRKVVQCLGSS